MIHFYSSVAWERLSFGRYIIKPSWNHHHQTIIIIIIIIIIDVFIPLHFVSFWLQNTSLLCGKLFGPIRCQDDATGEALYQRSDDTAEALVSRLEGYRYSEKFSEHVGLVWCGGGGWGGLYGYTLWRNNHGWFVAGSLGWFLLAVWKFFGFKSSVFFSPEALPLRFWAGFLMWRCWNLLEQCIA